MILPILPFGNPVLRQKGAFIREITDEIRKLARDMIETMHEAHGVGLAAQQVGCALQLAALDVRGTDRPSQLFLGTREVDPASLMPMVLINPQIIQWEGEETGSEGCLSFPGITGEIKRPGTVNISAMDLKGSPLQLVATGLLGRAIQHEMDHLDGVLFIDRMTSAVRKTLEREITRLEKKTMAALKKNRRKINPLFPVLKS